VVTEESKAAKREKPDGLWKVDDVAEYLNISTGTCYNKVVSKEEFPIALTPIPDSRTRRWIPKEVRKWAESRREKRK
jgi:predicted DNA-binding transcriptional regulator AlpA